MSKVYAVCEDYTGAFDGLFLDEKKAEERANEIGGYVLAYDLENIQLADNGEIIS